MKKIILTLFVALTTYCVSAQELAIASTPAIDLSEMYSIDKSFNNNNKSSLFLQNPCKDKITGRNLLIAGGCFAAVGAISYPLSFQMIDGNRTIGGLLSIGGLTCIGASIPMFIAGSVLYVRGKKNCVSMTTNGLTFNF